MPSALFKETFSCSEYCGMYVSMYLILPPQNLLSDGFKLMLNKDYPCVIICQGPSVLMSTFNPDLSKTRLKHAKGPV